MVLTTALWFVPHRCREAAISPCAPSLWMSLLSSSLQVPLPSLLVHIRPSGDPAVCHDRGRPAPSSSHSAASLLLSTSQAHSQTNSSRDLPKSNRRTCLLKPPLPGALRVQARVLRVPCKVTSLPVTLSPAPFLCLLCSSHIRCPGSAHTGTHEPRAGLRGLLLPHPGSLLPQELRRFLPCRHIRALSETFPAPCFSISLAMSDILPHLCFCSFCLCHRI